MDETKILLKPKPVLDFELVGARNMLNLLKALIGDATESGYGSGDLLGKAVTFSRSFEEQLDAKGVWTSGQRRMLGGLIDKLSTERYYFRNPEKRGSRKVLARDPKHKNLSPWQDRKV